MNPGKKAENSKAGIREIFQNFLGWIAKGDRKAGGCRT